MTDTYIADVSEFQGVIDWPTYGAHNSGVIVRAHNGYRPDNYWQRNQAGARANVAWRAWYQYLPANVDPAAAARAFQATTGPLEPGEVAILDLEEGSGDQRGRRQAWLDTLQDEIEWTYSGLSFARSHLPGVRIDWIAAYGQSEPTDSHTMWQFTNAHVFPGIARPCDASVFHGTILPGLSGGLGRGIGSGTGAVLTPTTTPEADMPLNQADLDAVTATVGERVKEILRAPEFRGYLRDDPWTHVIAGATAPAGDTADNWLRDARVQPQLTAQIAALQAALTSVSAGTGVDAATITAAAQAGAAAALATWHGTATITTGA